ncbi:MAG: hypothetical protein V4478_02095 [Patescibacteria group bacterium]
MDKNTKNLIIAGIAIVVVIAIAIAMPHFKKGDSTPAAVTPVETVATDTKTPVVVDGGKAAWEAMLKKFEGKTVTIAADCTATPITQSQKAGTTIVIVNDSDAPHIVFVGTGAYNIGARHYKTLALNTVGTTLVSCDSKTNVANIAVE